MVRTSHAGGKEGGGDPALRKTRSSPTPVVRTSVQLSGPAPEQPAHALSQGKQVKAALLPTLVPSNAAVGSEAPAKKPGPHLSQAGPVYPALQAHFPLPARVALPLQRPWFEHGLPAPPGHALQVLPNFPGGQHTCR